MLFVLALVVVDVVILLTYTIVEGINGNLEPMKVVNAENPNDIIGVSFSSLAIYSNVLPCIYRIVPNFRGA